MDLKSCNVLIAADGTAKISDVGLAALMSHQYLSRTAPAGTWAWVAPEVLMAGEASKRVFLKLFQQAVLVCHGALFWPGLWTLLCKCSGVMQDDAYSFCFWQIWCCLECCLAHQCSCTFGQLDWMSLLECLVQSQHAAANVALSSGP